MNLKVMRQFSITLPVIALLALSANAGVVYEIEVKDHEQSPPKTESIEAAVEGRNLKMGVAGGAHGGDGDMVFRGDRREMLMIDHDTRSYHVMDEAAIRQIGGQVSDAMAQMQDALKNVPADKRAMIEQMMKQKMPNMGGSAPQPPASDIRKTGERKTIGDYPCVKYERYVNGARREELWVTDWDNVKGGEDVAEVFADMADFWGELRAAMPKMGQSDEDENIFGHMKELGGFPVVTRQYGSDGSLEGESTLRGIRKQTLDPDAFEPPSGYKRQEMFR